MLEEGLFAITLDTITRPCKSSELDMKISYSLIFIFLFLIFEL